MAAGLVAQNMHIIFCGATIIDQSYAITAAHCVTKKERNSLALLVGDHNYRTGKKKDCMFVGRVSCAFIFNFKFLDYNA